MASELVEVVAIAIWEKASPLQPGPWNDDLNKWDRARPHDKLVARLQASVAIETLRKLAHENP